MRIILIRHGETEWSRSGQHTGRTDIALTEEGRARARQLGDALRNEQGPVFTSPLLRARETCDLAGFGAGAAILPDLAEWDYGIYEGRRTLDIRKEQPDWSIWLSPIPNGEQLDEVAARARRAIQTIVDATAAQGAETALAFAHGHILRVLAACWIGLPPITGRYLALDTASISILGYERQTRVIRQWNRLPD